MTLAFGGLVVCIGAAHLAAYYAGRHVLAGLLKALPVLLLASAVSRRGGGDTYVTLVALGLVVSAVGDVSLAFPQGFLAGLGSFLVAHLCYIAALAPGAQGGAGATVAALAIAAVAGAMLRYLWPHVVRERGAVVVYVGALATMTWCAIARALGSEPIAGAGAAALGAVSFLVSDGVLAVARFVRPFPGAHAVVMVTYYAAQLLIAASAMA